MLWLQNVNAADAWEKHLLEPACRCFVQTDVKEYAFHGSRELVDVSDVTSALQLAEFDSYRLFWSWGISAFSESV